MTRTRRAALAQSGYRFSLRQTRSVCAEIMLKQKGSEPAEPGHAPPGKMVAMIARPVDREWLPIGIAAIVLPRIAAGLARRGFRRRWSGAFHRVRHERRTRHAGGRIARACGG